MSLSEVSKKRQIVSFIYRFLKRTGINDHDDGILYLVNELIVDVDERLA
jgi:hypothetical protein